MTAISNAVLDKPTHLTRAERDRVETHTLLTQQMLRRSPALAALVQLAAGHHKSTDDSGYHKGLAARPSGRVRPCSRRRRSTPA